MKQAPGTVHVIDQSRSALYSTETLLFTCETRDLLLDENMSVQDKFILLLVWSSSNFGNLLSSFGHVSMTRNILMIIKTLKY